MANKNKEMAVQAIDCPQENSVHIAGEYGAEIARLASNFNTEPEQNHSDFWGKGTARGCSSAVERPVHIGKVRSSILRTPTTHRRFLSITQEGFADYFWSRVAVGAPAHCWPWKLSLNGDGYGQTKVGDRYWTASRLAFELANGPVPQHFLVCHRCDNPSCCNPAHLYAGTKGDNERDKFKRGRTHKGMANPGRKLTQDQVDNIRRLFAQGETNIAIGKMMGVHHSTISKIRTGASW